MQKILFNVKRKSSEIDNIFKYPLKNEPECHYINLQCKQECYCDKTKKGNIRKICFNKDILVHETNMYLELLDSDLFVLTSINENEVLYTTQNLISLRTFLKKNPNYMSLIINEVFAFVKSFKKYNFIHGNLHIDNIYIDIKGTYKFHVIDLCNSYILGNKKEDEKQFFKYRRKSYLDLHEYSNLQILYLDFISLYISLSLFYENNKKNIEYINSVIENHIGKKYFIDCLNYYHTLINNESYNRIKSKYNSF